MIRALLAIVLTLVTYGPAEVSLSCIAAAVELSVTHDYRAGMRPCLGEEDSAAVAIVLGE